jgi:hypothetical protein
MSVGRVINGKLAVRDGRLKCRCCTPVEQETWVSGECCHPGQVGPPCAGLNTDNPENNYVGMVRLSWIIENGFPLNFDYCTDQPVYGFPWDGDLSVTVRDDSGQCIQFFAFVDPATGEYYGAPCWSPNPGCANEPDGFGFRNVETSDQSRISCRCCDCCNADPPSDWPCDECDDSGGPGGSGPGGPDDPPITPDAPGVCVGYYQSEVLCQDNGPTVMGPVTLLSVSCERCRNGSSGWQTVVRNGRYFRVNRICSDAPCVDRLDCVGALPAPEEIEVLDPPTQPEVLPPDYCDEFGDGNFIDGDLTV